MPTVTKLPKRIAEREVVFPKRGAVIYCVDEDSVDDSTAWGGGPINEEVAGALLGWTTDPIEASEKNLGEPLGKDPEGNEFWCANNVRNRPLYFKGERSVESVLQEIFNARWRYNSEPIILGRSAVVLNGQHTLVAVKFACVQWRMESGMDWKRKWPDSSPFIEKLVTTGVEETDDVVNTMDTCKPRSLADVIYRCEYFPKKGAAEQKTLARILDHAVRYCWSRTGAGLSAFATYHTHSESIDWIERHKWLLKAVGTVYQTYKKKGGVGWLTNNKRLGAGYASALMFLMGVSGTSEDKVEAYREGVREGSGNDRNLDKSLWERVETFWGQFAGGAESFKHVYEEIGNLSDPDSGHGGSTSAKVCVLLNAWNLWVQDKRITPAAIRPKYQQNEKTFIFEQASYPRLKGIDMGDPYDPQNRNQDPPPDEIGEAAAEQRKRREEAKAGDDKEPAAGTSSGKTAGTKDRRGHTVPAINFND